jgi:hypothetical protein
MTKDFFERALKAFSTIDRPQRLQFYVALLAGLSVTGRASYVAAGVAPGETGRQLSAFNELLHQVTNKMRNDLFQQNVLGDYTDEDWFQNLRWCSHYLQVDVEHALAWALDQALKDLVPDWTYTSGGSDDAD